jgi:hypothetical protein
MVITRTPALQARRKDRRPVRGHPPIGQAETT